MKRKIYIALTIVVLGLLLLLLFSIRLPYTWIPNFDHDSKQPFGAAMFDSLMSASLPNGYEVKADMSAEIDPATDAVLYCKYSIGAYQFGFSNKENELVRAKKIMNFVKRGGNVIVATANIDFNTYGTECDSILLVYGLEYSSKRIVNIENNRVKIRKYDKPINYEFNPEVQPGHKALELARVRSFKDALLPLINEMEKTLVDSDTMTWVEDNRQFRLNPLYVAGSDLYQTCTTKQKVLMTYNYRHWHTEAFAFRTRYTSGGSVTFVAAPLLFSNYAVMDAEALQLTTRLLAPLQDKHLVRIEGKNPPDKKKLIANNDEFSFIRRHRSLRYAMYLFLAAMALAFVNYSRRRMRAIPLLPEEKNVTLDFARFMGTFHYRRHDYKQVLLNQYQTMLHVMGESMVRDVYRLDSAELRDVIVEKTRLPQADVGQLIRTVVKLQNTDATLTQEDMMKLLDMIRKIKEHFTL